MAFFHKIHCTYTGVKGFVTLYHDALRYRYMITQKALERARILAFAEKHGIKIASEAFKVSRRTLYTWKHRFKDGEKKPEALNEKKRTPKTKRKRNWHEDIIAEIKRLRWNHPNLGKDKIHPSLERFCKARNIACPQISTIGRLIKDCGGLRMFPQKVRHNGQIVPLKRKKLPRKPKDFKATYPGHLVALDTIERIVHGSRRYIITFEDIHTRFAFAWATNSHASLAAKEFFDYCRKVFPFSFSFVLTDNGSEFAKHFSEELKHLHLVHYHTYPRTPKMNAHVERFNRTIQEEFVDYHDGELLEVDVFNRKLIDWLIWYNTERPHWAFQNLLSPVEYIMSLQTQSLIPSQECKMGWTYTSCGL